MTASRSALRPLEGSDLKAVSDIHLAAFPKSALTKLGREAVRRYYEWQMVGPHDVAARGAWLDSELAGFCFGGVFRGALSGFVRKNRGFLIWRVAARPWLVVNPIFRERLSSALRVLVPRQTRLEPPGAPQRRSFGILSIAVSPTRAGEGIGKLLMVEMERIARDAGFTAMNLTVEAANRRAVGFYEGQGWRTASIKGDHLRMNKALGSPEP